MLNIEMQGFSVWRLRRRNWGSDGDVTSMGLAPAGLALDCVYHRIELLHYLSIEFGCHFNWIVGMVLPVPTDMLVPELVGQQVRISRRLAGIVHSALSFSFFGQ